MWQDDLIFEEVFLFSIIDFEIWIKVLGYFLVLESLNKENKHYNLLKAEQLFLSCISMHGQNSDN